MLVKTKAIVLNAIKYQDKNLIVKCFTQSDGIKTYMVYNVFSSKKVNQKAAYFQALTILEIEAVHKNKNTLETLKEVRLAIPFTTINTNVYKSTIVIFLSEILNYSIQEQEKNEALFYYLETALQWLDHHNETANFHLILMLEIAKFLGFYPDVSQSDLPYFDIIEGKFSNLQSITSISLQETQLFKKLLLLKFDHDQKTFSGTERSSLLKVLLNYYTTHLSGFKKPKSLDVLTAVFS